MKLPVHKRVLRVASGAIVLLLLAGAGCGYVAWQWWQAPSERQQPTRLIVERGTPLIALSEQLAAAGVIDHPRLFRIITELSGDAPRVKAGEFEFGAHYSPRQVLDLIVVGEVVSHALSIIEGWSVRQALDALQSNPLLEQTLTNIDSANLMAVLGHEDGPAEGWLFPDTYHFVRGERDIDLIKRAYQRMLDALNQIWLARDAGLPYQSPYELLIVASLIEKETGRSSDRPDISQVFVSRLNKRMRLQTDPSVIYGLGDQFDGNLTREHLRSDTPYNTYTRHGLPPTPIALPGMDSLQAAAHPGTGDYLYFVARGDGSSQFSRSLEEHLAAVRQYQLN
ncbi:MAG: endolytic transglycosylase MltG [Proteobacteria bacterium]|nr:endolytic transglycosylase MltG [Pseudomonadota bacterium]